jgi:NAD(P)-dependent dehydrogenase (short-subunit alcohol dehydrogenase family)
VYITGGSSGLGRALAEELVKRGAHVTIVARDLKKLEETTAALKVGRAKLETGDWRLETGDWRLETGDWRLETRIPTPTRFLNCLNSLPATFSFA